MSILSGGGIGKEDADVNKYKKVSDQKKANELAMQEAVDWIKNNPADWLVLEFRKLIRFYRITPYAKQYQAIQYKLMSIFSYGIIFVLSIYSLFAYREYLWLYSPMLLFSVLLTGVHLIMFASIRYRLPIEPFMIIVASYPIFLMINKINEKNTI